MLYCKSARLRSEKEHPAGDYAGGQDTLGRNRSRHNADECDDEKSVRGTHRRVLRRNTWIGNQRWRSDVFCERHFHPALSVLREVREVLGWVFDG